MTEKRRMTFEEFRDLALQWVEQDMESVDPDEDPLGHMLMVGEDGLGLVGFDPVLFNEDLKPRLASAITSLIAAHKPSTACFVSAAWQAIGTDPEYVEGLMPSQQPNRREVVLILTVDHEGESYSEAPIERHEGAPPTLGEWKHGPARGFDGRIVRAMRQGFDVDAS